MAEEGLLDRRDARAMGSFHLGGFDVAHRRADVLMVGDGFDLTQIS